MIAAAIVAGILTASTHQPPGPQSGQAQARQETVTEIRVHGNATLSDDAVIQLAGVALGSPIDSATIDAIAARLRNSGRFDQVEVRKRYRTLEMDEVALVLLVHETPGLSPTGEPPSPLHRLRSRLMFFPILTYEDGYGWTYGGQTSMVNVAGKGTRLSAPLSWGATRHAAVEVDRTFSTGPLTRLTGSFGITQRENPHFNVDDRRTELRARAERRLFDVVTLGADASRGRVSFAPARDRIWTAGVDATLDTRRDPAYPTDAVLATIAWSRLDPIGSTTFGERAGGIGRYTLDARGYKRLFGQSVLAVRAEYDTASAALPAYEQALLGGFEPARHAAGRLRRRHAAAVVGRAPRAVYLAAEHRRTDGRLPVHRRRRGRAVRRADRRPDPAP